MEENKGKSIGISDQLSCPRCREHQDKAGANNNRNNNNDSDMFKDIETLHSIFHYFSFFQFSFFPSTSLFYYL